MAPGPGPLALRSAVVGACCCCLAAATVLEVFPESDPGDAERRIAETFGKIEGFMWGTATAAYQVEGAWNKDGRQPSIWDDFSHIPGKVRNNQTGDVADEFYDRYASDIQRVKDYGFNAFRYSFSWTRIYPLGPDGKHHVNPKGIEFYKNVTATMMAQGITPMATLYHWDLPNDLDWLNSSVVDAFVEYADIVWDNFPEVKHWATFNEPWSFCDLGYGVGVFAPGINSKYQEFICGHNVLLAHAKAVALYREKYLATQQGTVGIVLNMDFAYPLNASDPLDVKAAGCLFDFVLAWFADPVYLTGDYPPCMKERLGAHLPTFTEEQKALVKGSVIGPWLQNTYSGHYAKWDDSTVTGYQIVDRDEHGFLIGPLGDSPWLNVVPRSIRSLLERINERYHPEAIIVTENGCDVPGEDAMPLDWALNDTFRTDFYRTYLDEAAAAVRESGVPLKGYFAWSLEDNFEWADGYHYRFGITYVNYTTQERFPKASAHWFTKVIGMASAGGVGGRGAGAPSAPLAFWRWVFILALTLPFAVIACAYSAVEGPRRMRAAMLERQREEGDASPGHTSELMPAEESWSAPESRPQPRQE